MASNPFHHLYVGEKVNPLEFVRIFSPKIVEHAVPLFQPGHVVLTGVQGSGKSMLYKLFDPAIRVAYAKSGLNFPTPKGYSNFIGSGININTSRCNEFGNRRTEEDRGGQEVLFGDFFNYLVCVDILRSVRLLGNFEGTAEELSISLSSKTERKFVEEIRDDPVWNGYLAESASISEIEGRMRQREVKYRRFLNYNDGTLDPEISGSKTSVGEPAKALVRALRNSNIVGVQTEFFILVDQYEELATIDGHGSRADYRSVVNKCISRDPTLSYRIGTRGYAWRDHLRVSGSMAHLEPDRDFKLVELDEKLREQELGGTSVFPEFANDVFLRRLQFLETSDDGYSSVTRISDVLGASLPASEEARILAGANPQGALELGPSWPTTIVAQLEGIAGTDPLAAKLAEVWYRQKGFPKGGKTVDLENEIRKYWRKERIELVLLKIAGKRKQRAIYSGESDLLGLSGGNILVFLSLCQYIWDYASQVSANHDSSPTFPISHTVQSISVFQTARTWLDRIPFEYAVAMIASD